MVTENLSSPRQVYFSFSSNGTQLGDVIISINEAAPRRAKQFVTLCTGHTGARYAGTNSLEVWNKGKHNEYLAVIRYLTSTGKKSYKNLFTDLEGKTSTPHKQGMVTLKYYLVVWKLLNLIYRAGIKYLKES